MQAVLPIACRNAVASSILVRKVSRKVEMPENRACKVYQDLLSGGKKKRGRPCGVRTCAPKSAPAKQEHGRGLGSPMHPWGDIPEAPQLGQPLSLISIYLKIESL